MDYRILRKLMIQVLKELPEKKPTGIQTLPDFKWLIRKMEKKAIDLDLIRENDNETKQESSSVYGIKFNDENKKKIGEITWDFMLQVILVPTSEFISSNRFEFSKIELSEDGRTFLIDEKYFPYDPDGYLAELNNDVPNLDSIVRIYVEESVKAFFARCYFASTVMLGVASEQLVHILIGKFRDALQDSTEKEAFEKKLEKSFSIKKKYDIFIKEFERKKDKILKELIYEFEQWIDTIFTLIRYYRNDAGHPSGRKISKNVAYRNLHIFPEYARKIYLLIEFLTENIL